MIYPWQESQWRQIMRQRDDARLPHACLFTGPPGTGKARFAHQLVKSLLCSRPDAGMPCGECSACRLVAAGTHPDAHCLVPAPPEKSTSKKPVYSIRIEAMRELCETLSETSQMQGYRTAVIEQAEKMNIPTANSLLKTLEEPGSNTLIILVSAHPNRLPVTVRSRCQILRFPVPARGVAEQWLTQHGHGDAVRVLPLVHGSPLKAIEWVSAHHAEHAVLADALTASQSGGSSLGFAARLAELPRDEALAWLLDWTGDVIRLATAGDACELVNESRRKLLAAKANKADCRQLYHFQDRVNELVQSGSIALNPQLMWENLLISWDNL